jgi:hypothetical protein
MERWVWLIIGVIVVVGISKIIYQIKNKNEGERGDYQQTSVPSTVSSNDLQQPSNLNEFGPVNYYANARHKQKDRWFQFMYRKVNGEWLTYILRMPSLNGRSGNLHLTHRYKSENTYWICYDPQPRTLEGAQSVSRAWGDRELEYIATGVPFEDQSW